MDLDKDILFHQLNLLLHQLSKLSEIIENEDEIFEMMKDRPYVCGNQTTLNSHEYLRIEVKISLRSIEIDY